MGWYSQSNWKSTKDVRNALITHNIKAHKATNFGRNLWTVQEYDGKNIIVLYMISRDGQDYMYKPISEDMGPCETDCPLELIAMCPPAGGYSSKWREEVLKAASKPAPKVGQKVTVYGKSYTIVGKVARSFIIQNPEGARFKCSARKMEVVG